MSGGFDEWLESLRSADDGTGEMAAGVMERLRSIFDARGPVGADELQELLTADAMQLAEREAAVFLADVRRTTTLHPDVTIFRDEFDSVAVAWNGNHTTPVFFALRAPEATVEIADNLRDHVVEYLWSAWPTCPEHGFGLYPRVEGPDALWWCRRHEHAVSAIGELPPTAGARDGLPS